MSFRNTATGRPAWHRQNGRNSCPLCPLGSGVDSLNLWLRCVPRTTRPSNTSATAHSSDWAHPAALPLSTSLLPDQTDLLACPLSHSCIPATLAAQSTERLSPFKHFPNNGTGLKNPPCPLKEEKPFVYAFRAI